MSTTLGTRDTRTRCESRFRHGGVYPTNYNLHCTRCRLCNTGVSVKNGGDVWMWIIVMGWYGRRVSKSVPTQAVNAAVTAGNSLRRHRRPASFVTNEFLHLRLGSTAQWKIIPPRSPSARSASVLKHHITTVRHAPICVLTGCCPPAGGLSPVSRRHIVAAHGDSHRNIAQRTASQRCQTTAFQVCPTAALPHTLPVSRVKYRYLHRNCPRSGPRTAAAIKASVSALVPASKGSTAPSLWLPDPLVIQLCAQSNSAASVCQVFHPAL